jgi:hypothetical protein
MSEASHSTGFRFRHPVPLNLSKSCATDVLRRGEGKDAESTPEPVSNGILLLTNLHCLYKLTVKFLLFISNKITLAIKTIQGSPFEKIRNYFIKGEVPRHLPLPD